MMKGEPLAITGLSVLFPGSTDSAGFWRDILAGKDLIIDVPSSHWSVADYYDPDPTTPDKVCCKRGAFLQAVPFDPLANGIPPNVLPVTDSSQILGLVVAEQVLADASRGQFHHVDRERISVILGTTGTTELTAHMAGRGERPRWRAALRQSGLDEQAVETICDRIAAQFTPWQENTFPGMLGNVIAGRIANRLNLGGTNCVIDAACASSLAAVAVAVNELRAGGSDLVIVGGVDTLNPPLMFMAFSQTHALSRSGDCRAFSAAADGTVLGEGLGMLALRRLADAERDGDPIYAVLRGLGASSDGRAKSIYAPVAEGQARAVRRAYEAAGFSTDTVELIEAHGTGTVAGDRAEFDGLQMVFDAGGRTDRQWCALGSVKSQVGHTKGAAGVAGLFKAVMALHHKVLPPTIKAEPVNPALHIDRSPFYLNTKTRPWIRDDRHPRRAGVSSFGFGGTNFHVALEEYNGPAPQPQRTRLAPAELLLWSDDSTAGLLESCRKALQEAGDAGPADVERLARTTQERFSAAQPARLAIVAADGADLRGKLEQAIAVLATGANEEVNDSAGLYLTHNREPGQVAFLFPGQGSQYVNMGADLAILFESVRRRWDEAASVLPGLSEIIYPRPAFTAEEQDAQAARLTATEWAQPALATCSLALLDLLREMGLEASCTAGHSFGELTALCAAGVLGAGDLVRLARKRGELMRTAGTTPGAMLAVAAPVQRVRDLLGHAHAGVEIANDNSPRQCVLSGPAAALAGAEQSLGKAGIACTRLAVSTAFHSALVEPAVRPLWEFLNGVPVQAPCLPVYSNTTAEPYPAEQDVLRMQLARQLAEPVRFRPILQDMYRRGVRTFLEVGPGAVLTGLVGDCLNGLPHLAVSLDGKGRHGVLSLWHALARLAVQGVAIRWEALWKEFAPLPPAPLTDPSRPVVMISGANLRPTPPAAALPQNPASIASPVRTEKIWMNGHSPAGTNGKCHTPLAEGQATPELTDAARRMRGPRRRRRQAGWVSAFQDILRETAAAQRSYQEVMAESCKQFFESMERSIQEVAAALGGRTPKRRKKRRVLPARETALTEPMRPARPAPEPVPVVEVARPSQPQNPTREAPAVEAAPLASPSPTSVIDFEAMVLGVVSEKTGYPVEVLSLDMEMEAGLGIDSIKRVEILSALEQRVPGLAGMDPVQVFGLRTLGDVLDTVRGRVSVPAATATDLAEEGAKEEQLGRLAVRLEETPGVGTSLTGVFDCNPFVLVAPPEGGSDAFAAETAQALAHKLRAQGLTVEVATEVPGHARGVVFLGGLHEPDSIDAAVAVNRAAFRAAQAFAAQQADRGGVFVTVQDTGGDLGLAGPAGERAWLGGLPGLVKTAAREWPKVSCKAIDIERGKRTSAELATAIEQELLYGGPEVEVALTADGRRRVIRCEAAPLAAADEPPALEEGAVVVVSGGARGVTAAALAEFAARSRPRLVLLGRTARGPEPSCCRGITDEARLALALLEQARAEGQAATLADMRRQARLVLARREIEANLEALGNAGALARYLAVDVQDRAALEAALDGVRREWGPIRGVIHGAGVLADRWIKDQTIEQFEQVFATKVEGLRSLLAATREDPLGLLVLFSSVAARFGNPGQCAYSMANEVLNKVAAAEHRRRGPSCRVKALNWGAWDGGMVTPALRAHFESRGVPLIPLEHGSRLFMAELTPAAGGVEVLLGCGDK